MWHIAGMWYLQMSYWALILLRIIMKTVIVNQVRYRKNYLTISKESEKILHARNISLFTQCFQQDGANCHMARDSLCLLLHANFGDCITSHGTEFP